VFSYPFRAYKTPSQSAFFSLHLELIRTAKTAILAIINNSHYIRISGSLRNIDRKKKKSASIRFIFKPNWTLISTFMLFFIVENILQAHIKIKKCFSILMIHENISSLFIFNKIHHLK